MVIYVRNNFNPTDNNKVLTVLRRWQKSLYWMRIYPGETLEDPITLPHLDDDIEIKIAADSPMRECTKNSRVTFNECLAMHVDIQPPSVMIDYPGSVETKDNMRKVSIYPGRHDWKVSVIHPEKAVDRWNPGLEPGSYPEELTIVVGDDVDL